MRDCLCFFLFFLRKKVSGGLHHVRFLLTLGVGCVYFCFYLYSFIYSSFISLHSVYCGKLCWSWNRASSYHRRWSFSFFFVFFPPTFFFLFKHNTPRSAVELRNSCIVFKFLFLLFYPSCTLELFFYTLFLYYRLFFLVYHLIPLR